VTAVSESPGRRNLLYAFILACGNFFFRFRNALFPLVFVILPFFTRPSLFLGSEALDRVVVILGILIALAGQSLRLLVIGYVYVKRGGKKRRIFAERLVKEGFYAHTRNPMYVGNFLITVGVGMIYGSPWIYFFVIPFFSFVYLSIVMAEETFLRDKFDKEYEDYAKRVNRFLPDLRGIKNSLKGFHYDWKRALRKDYGTIFGTLLGIVIVNAWKAYYLYGFQARKVEIITLALLLIPLGLLYALVRFLKLSDRLISSDRDL
jgi:protein-S-isoprenylcysteine O-methyltransferase Ste14